LFGSADLPGALHVLYLSNKILNRDVMVSANPGPPEKWPLKWRHTERFEVRLGPPQVFQQRILEYWWLGFVLQAGCPPVTLAMVSEQ